MFDLKELKQKLTVLREIPVSCVAAQDGEQPYIIVEISDDTRKREYSLAKKYNKIVTVSRDGNYEQEFRTDRLAYACDLADEVVKGSQRLFMENGAPAAHDGEAFKVLLKRYPRLLTWFLDAMTTAFADVAKFADEADADAEKN